MEADESKSWRCPDGCGSRVELSREEDLLRACGSLPVDFERADRSDPVGRMKEGVRASPEAARRPPAPTEEAEGDGTVPASSLACAASLRACRMEEASGLCDASW